MTAQRESDTVSLRLILVSGKTQDFTFSPNDSATDIARHVFENWPAGWEEEQELSTHPHPVSFTSATFNTLSSANTSRGTTAHPQPSDERNKNKGSVRKLLLESLSYKGCFGSTKDSWTPLLSCSGKGKNEERTAAGIP